MAFKVYKSVYSFMHYHSACIIWEPFKYKQQQIYYFESEYQNITGHKGSSIFLDGFSSLLFIPDFCQSTTHEFLANLIIFVDKTKYPQLYTLVLETYHFC